MQSHAIWQFLISYYSFHFVYLYNCRATCYLLIYWFTYQIFVFCCRRSLPYFFVFSVQLFLVSGIFRHSIFFSFFDFLFFSVFPLLFLYFQDRKKKILIRYAPKMLKSLFINRPGNRPLNATSRGYSTEWSPRVYRLMHAN